MTIKEIKDILDADQHEWYGIRGDRAGIQVGEKLANSHQWWQDDPEDGSPYDEKMEAWDGGELNGTCCIGIEKVWTSHTTYETREKDIEKAMALISKYKYPALYIIAGDDAEGGNDIGESIIRDAVVIGII